MDKENLSTEEINLLITELDKQLTGNLFEDVNIMDEIRELKETRDGVKHRPEDSDFECFGCGS
jgi:hypothetical protein